MIRTMLCVGGPWDGEMIASSADVMVLAESETHAYHRTRPTDTDWRDTYEDDWFIRGKAQPPPPPEPVWEWHERAWLPPEVRYIRDAVKRATERVR